MATESTGRTFLVAFLVCFICSLLVAGTAVGLRAIQEREVLTIHYRNVLSVTNLLAPGVDVVELWNEVVDPRLVDLETGEYSDAFDPATFDPRRAAADPALARPIPADLDLAGIRTRARIAPVYFIREEGEVTQVVLPVHGRGLWSTLYGYISLEPDLVTIAGFGFYEHAETPGLGGEIDNRRWLAQWPGKEAFDPEMHPRIEVIRGRVDEASPHARFQVDGISGATVTARGVTNLLHYWLGENAFGPFLDRLRAEGFND
jgi:Na+-transporting NADH:ubiquinone oxidoreductase subunit C